MKSAYRPSSFNEGTTYNERTDRFVGVDLTNPQISVSPKRGVFSIDYMKKNSGRVETRFGYEVVYDDSLYEIVGMWPIGDEWFALVHEDPYGDGYMEGLRFYQISLDSAGHIQLGSKLTGWGTDAGVLNVTYPNLYKPWGTEAGGKLWVLTGADFVVIYKENDTWKASSVESWSGVHIPTVTYMGVATNAKNIPSVTNVTLEYPNLLSPYRRDMFLTGIGLSEGCTPVLKIKLATIAGSPGDIEANLKFRSETKSGGSVEIFDRDLKLVSLPVSIYYDNTDLQDPSATDDEIAFMNAVNELLHPGALVLTDNADRVRSFSSDIVSPAMYVETGATVIGTKYKAKAVQLSYSNLEGRHRYNIFGVLTVDIDGEYCVKLLDDYLPIVDGKPNVTIKYQYVEDIEEQASFIYQAMIGCRFGANNSLNRLWIAYNNKLIHSAEPFKGLETGEIIRGEADFSYFPDEGLSIMGGETNSIVGLEVVSTDKMMVLKEKGGTERTMFFLSPTFMEEEVAENVSIIREEYSTSLSNTTTAGYPMNDPIVNFNGDILFLSDEKQLVGLDIEGITGDSQRVASTRSHYIDGELNKTIGAMPYLFSVGNYLFIFANSKAYVSNRNSFDSETRQYEFWPISLWPNAYGAVRFIAELGGDIYIANGSKVIKADFAQEDDKICDKEKIFFRESGPSYALFDGNGKLVVPTSIHSKLPRIGEASMNGLAKVTEPYTIGESESGYLVFKSDGRTLAKLLKKKLAVVSTTNTAYMGKPVIFADEGGFRLLLSTGFNTGYAHKNAHYKILYEVNDENDCWYFDTLDSSLCFKIGKIVAKGSATGNEPEIEYDSETQEYMTKDPAIFPFINEKSDVLINNQGARRHIRVVASYYNAEPGYVHFKFTGYVSPDVGDYIYECVSGNKPTLKAFALSDGKVGIYFEDANGELRLADFKHMNGSNFIGWIEHETPICPKFVTLRLVQGKLGYNKSIENLTLWNDSLKPCDLSVALISDESKSGDDTQKVFDGGLGFDFDSLSFEATDFDKNEVPRFYNIKKFKKEKQSFTLCFTAKKKRISVLSGVDILYKVRKAHNKK